jgi:hypothetical protein
MNFFIKIYDRLSFFLGKTKPLIKNLFSYFFIRIYLVVLIILNLFFWIVVIIMRHYLNQDIAILHYNVDFGINFESNNINKVFKK